MGINLKPAGLISAQSKSWDLKKVIVPFMRIGSLVLLSVILSFLNSNFFTIPNIMNILRQAAVLIVLSLGMTMVILTAGIDLSVCGVMSLVGCLAAQLLRNGLPVPAVLVISIGVGMIFGASNGLLVGYVGLPPFVSTYGMMWIANGISMILMGGKIIFGLSKVFRFFATGHIGIIPVIVIITALLALLFHLLLTKTVLGRNIYALGANRDAAFYSGIKTRKVTIQVYTLSGITAAIAGMLQTARLDAAEIGMGESFLLLAIAAVVMGGTSMLGGEGGIPGTVIGALILILVVNGMNLLDVPALAHPLVTGAVILIAVFFDIVVKKWERSSA